MSEVIDIDGTTDNVIVSRDKWVKFRKEGNMAIYPEGVSVITVFDQDCSSTAFGLKDEHMEWFKKLLESEPSVMVIEECLTINNPSLDTMDNDEGRDGAVVTCTLWV